MTNEPQNAKHFSAGFALDFEPWEVSSLLTSESRWSMRSQKGPDLQGCTKSGAYLSMLYPTSWKVVYIFAHCQMYIAIFTKGIRTQRFSVPNSNKFAGNQLKSSSLCVVVSRGYDTCFSGKAHDGLCTRACAWMVSHVVHRAIQPIHC